MTITSLQAQGPNSPVTRTSPTTGKPETLFFQKIADGDNGKRVAKCSKKPGGRATESVNPLALKPGAADAQG